jgi:3',5'-cyclic-AMP phosphodiesterase
VLIGQITDIHLGFEPGNRDEFNRKRLDRVIAQLIDGPNMLDMLLATGDLVDRGDRESYLALADALSACPFPVLYAMGNHDDRDNFAAVFPHVPRVDEFVQYEVRLDGVRLIVIDTLEPGRHGGAFCERRARWLSERLDEEPDIPVLIVMHHPPIEVGIAWMNTQPTEPWVQRFAATIRGKPQVKSLICGHLHRIINAPWQGTIVTICASTAPQVSLDLRPIDPETPDGRPMILAEPPAYAIHRWTDGGLVSHYNTVSDHPVLASYDDRMQGLVQALIAERPE